MTGELLTPHPPELIRPTWQDATHLKLNVRQGTIFWCTRLSIESAWMDGSRHIYIQRFELHESRNVLALTLDTERSVLYWCVYDQDRELITVYFSEMNGIYQDNQTSAILVQTLVKWHAEDRM